MATTPNMKNLKKADLLKLVAELTQQVEDNTTPAAEPTSKERLDTIVDDSDYTWTSGRTYVNGATVEGIARVLKTGNPEIVQNDVAGRAAAVGLFLTDKGSVAVQNLRRS